MSTKPERGSGAPPAPPPRWAARLGLRLEPGEGEAAGLLFAIFFLYIAFDYATKAVRQATFLDALGAERLPWVYLGVALTSYPLLALYSHAVERLRRPALYVGTPLAVAASLVVFWGLFRLDRAWVSPAFYLWVSFTFVLTVSQLWSLAGHAFDPRQARRLFGPIGAGGLLGGVAGGQVARWTSSLAGTREALLAAAALLVVAALLVHRLLRLAPAASGETGGRGGAERDRPRRRTHRPATAAAAGSLAAVARSPHLRLVAALVVLGVLVAQAIDLQFNWVVEETVAGLDDRTTFFGDFYTVVGVSGFLFQLLVTARIHRRLGVGAGLAVLPATTLVGSGALLAAGAFLPVALLPVAFALKAAEGGLRHSLDQSTRELLFVPLPASERLEAKAAIDVFLQRAAKGLAAVLLLPVAVGAAAPLAAGWLAVGAAAVWLAAARGARREYVALFRRGLERLAGDPASPLELSDATSVELLVEALRDRDPRRVLQALDLLAAHPGGRRVPPWLLFHDDPRVRRRTLEIFAAQRRRDLAPLVGRRLWDDDPGVRRAAVRALATLSGPSGPDGRAGRDLMRPCLEDPDPRVRAAAVAYLSDHGDARDRKRSADGLADLASDGEPRVRAAAAEALGDLETPRFQPELLALLYDPAPEVARAAALAVGRRAARFGGEAVFLPTLVARLADRRAKREAREALRAYGGEALPALDHFSTDPDESLWVRRALPKTIAAIGRDAVRAGDPATTRAALLALTDGLEAATDAFLRRKLAEALRTLALEARETRPEEAEPGATPAGPGPPPGRDPAAAVVPRLHRQVSSEAARALEALGLLSALGAEPRFELRGAGLAWDRRTSDPSLLERLLAERFEAATANVFALLAAASGDATWTAAARGLGGDRRASLAHAVEYLDNALPAELRAPVLALVEGRSAADRLAAGRTSPSPAPPPPSGPVAALARLLDRGAYPRGDEDDAHLAAAALYAAYRDYPDLDPHLARKARYLATAAPHPLVRETAAWMVGRAPL